MKKGHVGFLIVLTAALLTGLATARFLADQRQVIARATSPDGSWGVAVVGQKRLFGGIEVIVEVRDGRGRPLPYPGTYVIGISTDWASARRDFSAVSCGVTQAVVCGQTVLRKDHLGR